MRQASLFPVEPPATKPPPHLLNPAAIYVERAAYRYHRTEEVLAAFPDAERIEVASHWNIPDLHGDDERVESWNQTKRTVLVLGVRKGFRTRENGRSADYISPGLANGCAMACAYCYVARRKGAANPITLFVNSADHFRHYRRFAEGLPQKAPNQTDRVLRTFDVGESSDVSFDALLSDNVRETVALFRELRNAKATFATKYVNDGLLEYDPQGKTRIRFSLMPEDIARVVDVRTSPMEARIRALDRFREAGYEVHVNLSPVIVRDGWLDDYRELFRQVRDCTSDSTRAQLAAEIIFLTHHEGTHEANLRWHPTAEEWLWRPDLQEVKVSQNGSENVRYRYDLKRRYLDEFRRLLRQELPECRVRYAF